MIGKVCPPYSDREVIFFFVLDCCLEQVGKNCREKSQQQEYHGDDDRENEVRNVEKNSTIKAMTTLQMLTTLR